MIKNAFDNIKKTCEKELNRRYVGGIPEEIKYRLNTELEYLKNSDDLEDFELQRRFFDEAKKSMNLILTRGKITGSFIFYLIGNSKVNPLPAHYYCPNCGHYEEVGRGIYGVDLPKTKCPECGEDMISDGIDIPVQGVWGGRSAISFESNVSSGLFPYIKRLLERIYPDNHIEISGIQLLNNESSEFVQGGFFILPEGMTIDDYPELISYLDDGTKCMAASVIESEEKSIKKISMVPSKALDCAIYMQNKTGIYYDDINPDDIRIITYRDISNTRMLDKSCMELLEKERPRTFKMMCNLNAASHNTYDLKEFDDLYAFINSDVFKLCPLFVREDVFDILIGQGIDMDIAADYTKMVRMGQVYRYVNSPDGKVLKKYEHLIDMKVPAELYDTASKSMYLFPRAHAVSYMYLYAMLAFYMKKDSKAYSYYINHFK